MLTVRTILQEKGSAVFHVCPEDTVLDALREMAAHNCGALIVLEHGAPIGVVSERDYARKVVLMGRLSKDTLVREIMEEKLVRVPTTLGVNECMSLMTECRTRHLLAVDGERLAGVISIGDVVKAVIDEQQFTIAQLEKYITG
jgi:CBS domain-containing protein